MELELDGRRLAMLACFGLAVILLAAIVFQLVSDDNDDGGGFDAIDTNDTDNNPPVIESGPGAVVESTVGQIVGPIPVRATDADGDPLTFRALNLPAGITIDPATGTIGGTATAPCICEAAIIVDDGRGGTGETTLVWTVTGGGGAAPLDTDPPVLSVDGGTDNDSDIDVAAGPSVTNPQSPTSAPTSGTTPPSSVATSGATSTSNVDTTAVATPDSTASTAAPTTAAPTTAPSTTTTASTTAAGPASFQGARDFDSLFQGRQRFDAWSSGDIAFYAPPGAVPQDVGARWVEWYVQVDAMYRVVSGRSDFDSVYRRDTPDLGRRKVLGIVETCGAGCGSKQQAEADPGYIPAMTASPDDFAQHWIFFYEMGRGGSGEPWYGRATWPNNTVIIPHLMAGLAFYELGGEAGLRQGIPGDLLGELERWEAADLEYVDQFPIANQQSQGGYTSHHLMPAMLWRIRMETDLATVGRVTANMATKPQSTSAVQAMCDFRSAVNDATGGRFDDRMTGPWGLPDQC